MNMRVGGLKLSVSMIYWTAFDKINKAPSNIPTLWALEIHTQFKSNFICYRVIHGLKFTAKEKTLLSGVLLLNLSP